MIANYFGTNNTVGDTDSGDLATTGMILFSAVVPVTDTLVVGNVIAIQHLRNLADGQHPGDRAQEERVLQQRHERVHPVS